MNILFFVSAFSIAMTSALVSIDGTVNTTKEPSLSVGSAIAAARKHFPTNGVVYSATAHRVSSNEWWYVSCRDLNEDDGYRTNYTCIVSAQDIRMFTSVREDCGLPEVSYLEVLSALKERAEVKETEIVEMGWLRYSESQYSASQKCKWIVRSTKGYANGYYYEVVCRGGRIASIGRKKNTFEEMWGM